MYYFEVKNQKRSKMMQTLADDPTEAIAASANSWCSLQVEWHCGPYKVLLGCDLVVMRSADLWMQESLLADWQDTNTRQEIVVLYGSKLLQKIYRCLYSQTFKTWKILKHGISLSPSVQLQDRCDPTDFASFKMLSPNGSGVPSRNERLDMYLENMMCDISKEPERDLSDCFHVLQVFAMGFDADLCLPYGDVWIVGLSMLIWCDVLAGRLGLTRCRWFWTHLAGLQHKRPSQPRTERMETDGNGWTVTMIRWLTMYRVLVRCCHAQEKERTLMRNRFTSIRSNCYTSCGSSWT